MTKKIINKFHALNLTTRIFILISALCLLLVSSMMLAMAADSISFSGHTPGDGTTVKTSLPSVGVNVYNPQGVLNSSDLMMTLDNNSVTPVLTSGTSPGDYSIKFNPSIGLTNGSHTVSVGVYDSSISSYQTTNWSFTIDASPKIIGMVPLANSNVNSSSPIITIKLKDSFDKINPNSLILKIDSVVVNPQFNYKGYWTVDEDSGESYYEIQSNKEGTVEYQASNLTDGVHTAELSIADVNGNVLTTNWAFTVATKPVFSSFSPTNGAAAKSISGVSVKVFDYNLQPDTIVLQDYSTQINHTYNSATGIISYNNNLSYGTHKITVSAADTNGNVGTATWSFLVDSLAPTLTLDTTLFKPQPGNPWDTVSLSGGLLKFHGTLKDLSDITPDTVLKLDGQALTADINYELSYDDETGDAIESKKTVYVNYEGQIADGTHTLTLTRGDILGNSETKTWTVNVATKPVITQWKPVTFISELTPTISANVKDLNNVINVNDIKMSLDGKAVTPTYDPTTGNLTYKPAGTLINESYHTVQLSVNDQGQPSSNISWSFYINTFPDMPDSNMSNCSACHTWDSNAAIPFQELHKAEARFGGDHGTSNECNNCHSYITYDADCLQCHGPDGIGEAVPHGSTPSIQYSIKNFNPYKPYRVTTNREMWDCVICHQPDSPVLGHYPSVAQATKVLENHDIPELHKAEVSSCNECHALSLTREHAREGRVDKNDQPITCNTCHKSTDTKLTAAITNNKKNCGDCHGQADHAALHNSDLDANCQQCHSKEISTEHINNPKTTAGNNYTCDTCHKSTDLKVKRTIAANDLSCTGCHKEGHNINLSEKIPVDIPLFADYQWSSLTEASIFTGDTAIPAGYGDGQVMISNRRNNISADQVWTFYKEELIDKGWSLKSDIPTTVPASFTAEFEKGTRSVSIKSYDTQVSDGSGPTTGRRIEIWYKVMLD